MRLRSSLITPHTHVQQGVKSDCSWHLYLDGVCKNFFVLLLNIHFHSSIPQKAAEPLFEFNGDELAVKKGVVPNSLYSATQCTDTA